MREKEEGQAYLVNYSPLSLIILFETRFHFVAHAGLELAQGSLQLMIVLSLPSVCYDYTVDFLLFINFNIHQVQFPLF